MQLNTISRITLGICGMVLSWYALQITISSRKANEQSPPFCELDSHVSCVTMYTSIYARGFGVMRYVMRRQAWLNVPNAAVWLCLYGIVTLFSIIRENERRMGLVMFSTSLLSMSSMFTVYAMYRLNIICILSILLYLINCSLLFVSFKRFNEISVVKKYKAE